MKTISRWAWVGALLAAGACEDEVLVGAIAAFSVEPTEIDFGVVSLGQEATAIVELTNRGTGTGTLEGAEIVSACDCFFVRTPVSGREVAVGQTLEIQVVFRARQVSASVGQLVLQPASDRLSELTVELRGEGRDDSRPAIEVVPAELDFGGVVAVGGTSVDTFVIRSVGQADLLVDRIAVEPSGVPFRITTSTPAATAPGRLAPGEEAEFVVRAAPDSAPVPSAQVVIDTNVLEPVDDPEVPGRVIVPITPRGNRPPVADFVTNPDPVEPFRRVDLDASPSFDPDDPPDEPLTYAWELVSVPRGSQARLQSRTAPQSAFFADVSGEYVLALEVTDALGTPGRVVRTLSAVPQEGIRVELIWDHPESDVDLHFIRGNQFCTCGMGVPGADSDVHYRCREGDWYPETPAANPVLDVDDRSGFGPEVVLMREPESIPQDRFIVAVHYFNDKRTTSSYPTSTSNATVRIFISGLLVAEFDQALLQTGDLWEVAAIDWPSGEIQEAGAVREGVPCGFF